MQCLGVVRASEYAKFERIVMEENRECKVHGLTAFGFHKDKNLPSGGRWRCKECQAAATRKNMQGVRDYATSYKLESGCVNCGYNKFARALHFAHKDPSTKTKTPAQIRNVDALKAEIDKCVVLCSNCHAEWDYGVIEITT